MKVCRYCGTQLEDQAQFCMYCGRTQEMEGPQNGAWNYGNDYNGNPWDRFRHCGEESDQERPRTEGERDGHCRTGAGNRGQCRFHFDIDFIHARIRASLSSE